MITKIKNFLKNSWYKIVAVLGAIIGFLLYYINLKNKNINALKAKVSLLNTQKDADVLESQIKELIDNRELLAKEQEELEKTLDDILQKRKEIMRRETGKSIKEIESYWENN